MLKAHDLGMTHGEYVFYTIDMLPEEEVLNPEAVWKSNDGRDVDAQVAFQSVFHVSTFCWGVIWIHVYDLMHLETLHPLLIFG